MAGLVRRRPQNRGSSRPAGDHRPERGEEKWKHQADVLQGAVDFQKEGGKLVRLEFPRTEVQHFGAVAIVWSEFLVETEVGGKRSTSEGRANEVFVLREGHWVNPGWHTETLRRSKKE
jgi:hypothetical protein